MWGQHKEQLRKHPYGYIIQVLVFLIGTVTIHHVVIGKLLELSAQYIIKTVIAQIAATILPGVSLCIVLYKKKQTILGKACASYILGYSWNIVMYFLLVPFGLKDYVSMVIALFALVSALVILKKGQECEWKETEKLESVFYFLFLLFLLLTVFVYEGANAPPVLTGSAKIPTDHLFWIENAAALSKGFPANDLRVVVDNILYYHYFSSIQIAFESIATGVDCFTLGTSLGGVAKTFIVYGALYLFTSGITEKFWLRMLGVVGLAFSCGLEGHILVTYTHHFWTHPFGFDMGFAFAMFFLHCFYLQYEKKDLDYRILFLSVLSMLICTGLKAPVAAVVIIAAGIVCFGWLAQKQFKLAFFYGISLLVAFFVVMVFCVGFGGDSDDRVGGLTLWSHIRDSTEFLRTIYGLIPTALPESIKMVFMLVIFHLGSNALVFGLYFAAGILALIDREMWTFQLAGLFLAAAAGIFLGVFNVQDGNSQMYFTMSALIPCMAFGLIWLDHNVCRLSYVTKCGVTVILTGTLMLQVLALLFYGYTAWGRGLDNAVQLGYANLFSKTQAQQEFDVSGLQRDDEIALRWIRENTPVDSVVLSDRSVVGNMPQYMYYGAFSERQAYLEGDIYYRKTFQEERERMRSIIQRIYQNDTNALREAIEDGVDYLVQTKWLTPEFVPNPEQIQLIFAGKSINIYEIVK